MNLRPALLPYWLCRRALRWTRVIRQAALSGMMVFPANRIDAKATINAARRLHLRIKDRLDLTLECIRRFYLNQDSPLEATLNRYAEFFRLIPDFRDYVEFFLLQALATGDGSPVQFFTPFTAFEPSPLPANLETYWQYRQLAVECIQARNEQISRCAAASQQR